MNTPPADSLLLRSLGGDLERYREAKARIERNRADELRQLRRQVHADELQARRALRLVGGHDLPRHVVDDQADKAPAVDLVALTHDWRFLDKLADALLGNEELFRPIINFLSKKQKATSRISSRKLGGDPAGETPTPRT